MIEQSTEPRNPIDIQLLTQFLDSLHSKSTDLVQHLRSGLKLCHYTSLEGAIGIVSSGDLWLTNSIYSNDNEELQYGYRLVDSVLDEMEASEPDPARAKWWKLLRTQINVVRNDHVYVCCFCEKENLLSQWRGYAENGGGVCIEFDHTGFKEVSGPDSMHGLMRLWKVFYDPEQQRKIIRDCVEYAGWSAMDDAKRIQFIVDTLQFFMPTFKNSDFREEQERRLIFTPYPNAQPRPRFRTSRGLLVPYYSLRELSETPPSPTFRLPIKSLLIGPSNHADMNRASAQMMLERYGFNDVPVVASTTPYRS